MNLVIVESPTKAKTISTFLKENFKVVSSKGHIRDLPKSKLGIDIEKNFTPHYIIPLKAKKTVNLLKKEAKEAEKIILATDEDREGEAIAWHLVEALSLKDKPYERIVFHEITKPAIEEALKNPRKIDLNLVNAQQSRRILDRLVGYELSPFLWKKLFRGLSAGRVQSPALRLIVEREKERLAFKPEEYYTIEALFYKDDKNKAFKALLYKINNKVLSKTEINSKQQAEKIKESIDKNKGVIIDLKKEKLIRSPLSPFITSSLQQTAFQIFRYPAKKTMQIAQALYEGKTIGKDRVGLITYMRTDSYNISDLALKKCHDFIRQNFDKKYVINNYRLFKFRSRLAQEAHEAIRPTDPFLTPEKVKPYLSKEEFNLYNLIWQRFVASQMSQAEMEKTEILIEVEGKDKNKYLFKSSFLSLIFDGFFKVYPYNKPQEIVFELPNLTLKDILSLKEINLKQHFTQPPPRYNDASLIKTLENYGIGRPSTYAPIINVLFERGYIKRDENKALMPTEVGILVADLLIKHFPQIVDYNFTSLLEESLDKIALAQLNWQEVIKNFYYPFKEHLDKKYEEVSKEDLMPKEKIEEKCPLCGNDLIIKYGKYGKFIACSNWPTCKYTKSLNNNSEETDITCPICKEGKVVIKRNKKGKLFYACSRYPDCKFVFSYKPLNSNCPECGSYLIETKTKIKCSNKKCLYERVKDKN
ncbi:MAG: type I DNA topoisomerase [Minisyncoccia bacterium]